MYFLFGISGMLFLAKICDFVSSINPYNINIDLEEYFQLKEYFDYEDIDLKEYFDYENVALQCILLYNKTYTICKDQFMDIYIRNEAIHNSVDLFVNLYLNFYSAINKCRVEYYGCNWINIATMYKQTNKNEYSLVETYKYIHYNSNSDISDMIIKNSVKPFSNENKEDSSTLTVKGICILKYNEKYLCCHNKRKLYDQWHSLMEYTTNPFFEIEYVDNYHSIPIDIPKSYFIKNNEILSSVFLKRWFDYTMNKPEHFVFTNHYKLKITDEDFNEFDLHCDEFIMLNDNGYSIEKIK